MSNIKPKAVVILHALCQGMDIALPDRIDRHVLRLDERKDLCKVLRQSYKDDDVDHVMTLDWTLGQFIRTCNSISDEQFGVLCATFALGNLQ